MPNYTIETGTVSSTVLGYAQNIVSQWDYYVLYDNQDSQNNVEEYILITSENYDTDNNQFITPTVFHFEQIQIYDSNNHPTNTYKMTVYEINQNLNFPANSDNLIMYSNVGKYPNFERRVDNAQTQNLLLFGWLIPVCIIHVCIQFISRKHAR